MTRARNLVLAAGVLGALVAGCGSSGELAPVAAPTTSPAATATPEPTSASAEPTASPGGGGGGAGTPGGGGVTSDPPAPGPVDTNPALCATSELKGSVVGGDAGAGSVYATLVLTNTGSRTCELRGFPGVSYVAGNDGHQVGPAAAMSGARGGQVQLAPGKAAGAQLQLVQVANFDAATCKPTPVRGLRVYPPGNTASLFVTRAGTGCSASTLPGNQLSVQTLKAQ